MRSTPWAPVIIFPAAGRGSAGEGIKGLADPAAYRLVQGQERLAGPRPPLSPVRHRRYSPAVALRAHRGLVVPGFGQCEGPPAAQAGGATPSTFSAATPHSRPR